MIAGQRSCCPSPPRVPPPLPLTPAMPPCSMSATSTGSRSQHTDGVFFACPLSDAVCRDADRFATNNNTTSGPLPPKGATPPPEADVRSLHFKTLRSFKKVRLQSAWRVVWDVHSWLSGEGKEDKPNEIVLPMCPFICYPLAEISYRVHVSRSAERADTQQHACNVGQPAERP